MAVCGRGLRRLGHVLSWLVIVGVGGVLVVAVLVPRLAGATPYVVLTGSMRPDLSPGTLVVVRPVPVERIGIGDVVTFQVRSGDPTVVTHRVVGVGVDGEGERVFTTQGDANDAPDGGVVRAVQLRGEVWYAAPWVGHLTSLLSGGQHALAVRLVTGGLLAYALIMFAAAWRDRAVPGHRGRHAARHRPLQGPA